MSDRRLEATSFFRRMAADGPPLGVVVVIFIILQVLTFGSSYPLLGGMTLAIGLLVALVIDLTHTRRDQGADGQAQDGFWLRPHATTHVRDDDLRYAKRTLRGDANR